MLLLSLKASSVFLCSQPFAVVKETDRADASSQQELFKKNGAKHVSCNYSRKYYYRFLLTNKGEPTHGKREEDGTRSEVQPSYEELKAKLEQLEKQANAPLTFKIARRLLSVYRY